MAYAIAVRADIVDIRTLRTPPAHLFVDTQVWFWHTYVPGTLSLPPRRLRQITTYLALLQNVLKVRGNLYHSDLQLAELLHLIERVELDDFNIRNASNLRPKEFRHGYPLERQMVVGAVQAAWADVIRVSDPITCAIDPTMTRAALTRFATQPLDGYDLFFIESLLQSKVTTNVLTEDGDFATVPGITVYTANDRVIQAAASAGTLIAP